jgi:hypothetical protein
VDDAVALGMIARVEDAVALSMIARARAAVPERGSPFPSTGPYRPSAGL